jgi:hypothetical protein
MQQEISYLLLVHGDLAPVLAAAVTAVPDFRPATLPLFAPAERPVAHRTGFFGQVRLLYAFHQNENREYGGLFAGRQKINWTLFGSGKRGIPDGSPGFYANERKKIAKISAVPGL